MGNHTALVAMMRISWRSEIMLLRIDMHRGADLQRQWNLSKFFTRSWCTLLLLASIFRIGISSVKADIRCYCNLPVCISKNYMCKSSSGLCISQRSKLRGPSWTKHGCIEMFSRWSTAFGDSRPICPHKEGDDDEEALKTGILCCKEDMCNYGHFDELSRPINKNNSGHLLTFQKGHDELSPHQEGPWLRSAVISVPVAGGCVLILLIITAAKLLKKDMKTQQVPSFPSSSNKEQLSTSRRIFPKSQSSIVVVANPPHLNRNCVSSASVNVLHQTPLYRHVPVTVSLDSTCTDTSRDKYFVFDV